MEGTIEVKSVLDQGSAFTFTIPTTEHWNEEPSRLMGICSPADLKEMLEEQSFSSMQVLVAEDELINQKVIGKMLQRLGCKHQVPSHSILHPTRSLVLSSEKQTINNPKTSWHAMESKQWR